MYVLVIGCPIIPLMSSSGFSPRPQPLGKGRPWHLGVLQCENLTPTYPLQGSSMLITTPLWMSEPRRLFPWFRQGRGTLSGILKDKLTQIEKSRHPNGDTSMCQVQRFTYMVTKLHHNLTKEVNLPSITMRNLRSRESNISQVTQLVRDKARIQTQVCLTWNPTCFALLYVNHIARLYLVISNLRCAFTKIREEGREGGWGGSCSARRLETQYTPSTPEQPTQATEAEAAWVPCGGGFRMRSRDTR